jgi:hypothetical protein
MFSGGTQFFSLGKGLHMSDKSIPPHFRLWVSGACGRIRELETQLQQARRELVEARLEYTRLTHTTAQIMSYLHTFHEQPAAEAVEPKERVSRDASQVPRI